MFVTHSVLAEEGIGHRIGHHPHCRRGQEEVGDKAPAVCCDSVEKEEFSLVFSVVKRCPGIGELHGGSSRAKEDSAREE